MYTTTRFRQNRPKVVLCKQTRWVLPVTRYPNLLMGLFIGTIMSQIIK